MTEGHRCTPFPGSGETQAAVDESCRYRELCDQIAFTMGAVNVANGQLFELARAAIDEGLAGGYGLKNPADWLAWRTGLSKERCNTIVALVKRAPELPCTVAAVVGGELTLDQAAPIVRHVPASHERAASEFARSATVAQLHRSLSQFGFEAPGGDGDGGAKPTPAPKPELTAGSVSRRRDDRGWRLDARLPDDEAARFDQALAAAREDLYQQRKAETPDGMPVPPVTWAEALDSMAESYLSSGQAARPGSDRYQVHLHLEAGTEGPVLVNHLGLAIAESARRMILCDCSIRVTTWDGHNPLSVGRKHRVVTRRMRRAIEHRDGGCVAPGCTRTVGLHIHHIIHWEDGGATDTDNLLTLCTAHHRLHHDGLLGIARTADVEPGAHGWITFRDHTGRPLDACGTPVPRYRPDAEPGGTRTGEGHRHDPHHDPLASWTPARHAHRAAEAAGLQPDRYQCPTGERFRLSDLSLSPDDPPDPDPSHAEAAEPPDGGPQPPSAVVAPPPDAPTSRPVSNAPPAPDAAP